MVGQPQKSTKQISKKSEFMDAKRVNRWKFNTRWKSSRDILGRYNHWVSITGRL